MPFKSAPVRSRPEARAALIGGRHSLIHSSLIHFAHARTSSPAAPVILIPFTHLIGHSSHLSTRPNRFPRTHKLRVRVHCTILCHQDHRLIPRVTQWLVYRPRRDIKLIYSCHVTRLQGCTWISRHRWIFMSREFRMNFYEIWPKGKG